MQRDLLEIMETYPGQRKEKGNGRGGEKKTRAAGITVNTAGPMARHRYRAREEWRQLVHRPSGSRCAWFAAERRSKSVARSPG